MRSTPSSGSHAPGEPVNILLVDDQAKNLVALEAILGDLGQHLVSVQSGKQALREILARDFAVILLDVQMPDMDGYETASLIRQRAASSHTPIIFLTASHSTEVRPLHGYSVGAVDYLFKPLDADILRSKVAVFVELAKKSRELHQLAEARATLLAELEQKHRELAEAHEEIESFSYSVSHDLRAPLRSIDAFSQALLEDCGAQLDGVGHKYLGAVRGAAQQMTALIDGLLELARVSRSELRRQRVDLTRLAREAAARLQLHAPERATTIGIADGMTGAGDPRLLAAVFDNLIGNAWKFTRHRKRAQIEVGVQHRDGAPVYFVRDDGAGFDMAYAHKLFGAFQRLHPANEYEGHGIGLATVHRIVRRHGGQIWAEGEPGAGATFYFTLDGTPATRADQPRD